MRKVDYTYKDNADVACTWAAAFYDPWRSKAPWSYGLVSIGVGDSIVWYSDWIGARYPGMLGLVEFI